ncbi:hypothetical protein BJF79_20445 [Actinomadura sp. CNU-125]|uniref:hypothetical protein n=1 Tax=Actinomadura sp. CNU-125 TaxID=1904961 RepID=UPI0009621BEC|nr:hypothetical protein [Actinomadura sp. CNU-125]OLT13533.1 hypothetical protein BJF79_20445 [Actinomadura sp. CNU-125]
MPGAPLICSKCEPISGRLVEEKPTEMSMANCTASATAPTRENSAGTSASAGRSAARRRRSRITGTKNARPARNATWPRVHAPPGP